MMHEVKGLCEIGGSSKQNRKTVWIDFFNTGHHLKNKDKIGSAIPHDGRTATQKQMRNTENKDLEPEFFQWFHQENQLAYCLMGQ
jgi:hypothetical protein